MRKEPSQHFAGICIRYLPRSYLGGSGNGRYKGYQLASCYLVGYTGQKGNLLATWAGEIDGTEALECTFVEVKVCNGIIGS
jgi:hypothetical protein